LQKELVYRLLTGLFLFILPLCGGAQEKTVTLTGVVLDDENGEPIPNAIVYLHETGQYSICNDSGYFKLAELKPAIYHIHATMQSFEPFAMNYSILRDTSIVIRMKPTIIELSNFTVEADMLKTEQVKNPLSIEAADRKFIERQGGNTFANSLEKIPGITSINTGVGIAKPVIRGMSFNRVVVTENGIRQEGQQWGSDHGLELDQFNVDRVEIQKGPASLIYGSDAIAGVINILPAPIPLMKTGRTEVMSIYRSNNETFGGTAMTEFNTKNYFFRARVTWLESGDYKVPADSFIYNNYVLPIYDNSLKNTASNELNYSMTGGVLRNWGMIRLTYSSFHQQVGLFPGATGIPRAYNLLPDGNTRNIDLPFQTNDHQKAIANINVRTKKGWLETDLGFQFNHRIESTKPHSHGYAPDEWGSTALDLRLQTYSLNSRLHHTFNPHLKGVFGVNSQYITNRRGGFEFLVPDYESITAGVYGFVQYLVNDQTTISGGLRADYGNLILAGFDSPVYDSQLQIIGTMHRSPKLNEDYFNYAWALGISLEPSHEFNIKINTGKSFRLPTAVELGGNGIHHGTFRHEMGDSTLNAENGYQVDVGFILHNKKSIFKLTPYFSYFTNYLFLRPAAEFSFLPDAGQIYRYTQAEVIHGGFELYSEYHLISSLHLETAIEYIWNYNLDTYLPLPFSPPPSGSLSVEYVDEREAKEKTEWFIGAEAKYYLAQNRIDRNEKATPAYTLISANGGFTFHMEKISFQLFLRVSNLTNLTYLNHLSRYRLLNIPEQGRNYSITLKVPLNYHIGRK
jgi:iron complex outermembrane recepter protein